MRWRTVLVALGLGMVVGAGFMAWEQRQQIRTWVGATAPQPSGETIPLIVEHDRGVLRLRWSPNGAGIRNAGHGTLTITDGKHQSRLELDARELGTGLASYWPDWSRVGFRLETDSGASGFIEAPVEDKPSKPAAEVQAAEGAKAEPDRMEAPARRQPKPAAGIPRVKPIDDGLEWTQQPPQKGSRWTRFKRKVAFWRQPAR
jgi:hypothetical protein